MGMIPQIALKIPSGKTHPTLTNSMSILTDSHYVEDSFQIGHVRMRKEEAVGSENEKREIL